MDEARNKQTLLTLIGVVMLMGGAAWASVPLYNWFCRVTGFGGATVRAESVSGESLERTMKVRFDASRGRDMPWNFRAVEREIELKIGESALAFYEAHNPTKFPVAGAASFNVYPFSAGGYFVKIDCFCFEEQLLQSGERVQMPVSFYIDPEIVNDPETRSLRSITLSYTFHRIELPHEEKLLTTAESRAAGRTANF